MAIVAVHTVAAGMMEGSKVCLSFDALVRKMVCHPVAHWVRVTLFNGVLGSFHLHRERGDRVTVGWSRSRVWAPAVGEAR